MTGPDEAPDPGDPLRESAAAPNAGEMVANTLRGRIVSGELQPGDRLPPEDELMANLRMSRATTREGLRILESHGLIEVRRGRSGGGVVTRPRIDHVGKVFAVSLQMSGATYRDVDRAAQLIEPSLVQCLAENRTAEDLRVIGGVIARTAVVAARGERGEFAQAASAFHEALIVRAGNKTLALLALVLREVRTEYYRWASQQTTDKEGFERAVRSYRKLYRLIEARDGPGAERHWRRQLIYVASQDKRNYDEQLGMRSDRAVTEP